MDKGKLIEIVDCITEAADELKEKKNKDQYDEGQLLAYAEVLCIIQDAFAGEDLKEIGLDFDIDQKYLF